MKFNIVSRFDASKILFAADIPDDTESGLQTRVALEQATAAKAYLGRADLGRADLGGAYLGRADLRGAYLGRADLSGAYLGGAYLGRADLSGADLSGADLSGADLSGADLSGAYLRGAYLGRAYLRGAYLGRAYLRGADLGGAYLRGAYLRGAYLRDGTTTVQEATPEQAIANLDKVREIILDNKALLEMNHWHDDDSKWQEHTCAEEAICGTTHCLAGWLQVCSTDPVIRKMEPNIAGIICAPVSSKMFFRDGDQVLEWLEQRKYVEESNAG